ncbi:DUF4286 family protein [Paludibacter sp.]
MKWVKEEHVPFMLKGDTFSTPQIAKVLSHQDEQDGISYSVQYRADSTTKLNEWYEKNGHAMEDGCIKNFGESVLFFPTILEIIE